MMSYRFFDETRGIAKERYRLALRSPNVDYPGGASLAAWGKKVTENHPPAGRQKRRLRVSIWMSR